MAVEVLEQTSNFWVGWRKVSKEVLEEGEPLDIEVSGNRLKVSWRTGWDPTGTAREGEPWVTMVLVNGQGVRARLQGHSDGSDKTHYIVSSPAEDTVDGLTTNYRQIILEEPGVPARGILVRHRVVIKNPNAFPRRDGPTVEDYLGVRQALPFRQARLLGIPQCF